MAYILGLLYLAFYPFAFYSMITYSWDFNANRGEGNYQDFIRNSTLGIASILPPILMVYFKKYLPKLHWILYFLTAIGSLLMTTYMARRGGSVTMIMYLAFCWLLYLACNKRSSKVQLVLAGAIIAFSAYTIFTNNAEGYFSTLVERGTTDSRSGVEEAFYDDMDLKSWLFGRGWFGTYYDKSFNLDRLGVETGFLTLILRGGLLYVIPYISLLFFSGLRGLFHSNSIFVKSFAIMSLMHIFELYPFGWPDFTFKYFIVWLGVYVCNKRSYLKLTDEEVKQQYFS